jgi:hypothetical protein
MLSLSSVSLFHWHISSRALQINGEGKRQFRKTTPVGVGDDYLRLFEQALSVLKQTTPDKKIRLEDLFRQSSPHHIRILVLDPIEPPSEMDSQIEEMIENALSDDSIAKPEPQLRKRMGRPTRSTIGIERKRVRRRDYNRSEIQVKKRQREEPQIEQIRTEKHTLNESVLYIFETWDRHVTECGGHLKPTQVPRALAAYGLDGCYVDSLPQQIARWIELRGDEWNEIWDGAIAEMKTNYVFNGQQPLQVGESPVWSPTLEFLFRNRDHLKKDIGINAFLDGDFAHFQISGKAIVEGGEPTVREFRTIESKLYYMNLRQSRYVKNERQKTTPYSETFRARKDVNGISSMCASTVHKFCKNGSCECSCHN